MSGAKQYTPFDAQEWLEIQPKRRERIARHYGPGAHPGTGTDQQVHAGDDAGAETERPVQHAGTPLPRGVRPHQYYAIEHVGTPRDLDRRTAGLIRSAEQDLYSRDPEDREKAYTISDRIEVEKVGTSRDSIYGAFIHFTDEEIGQMERDVLTHSHPSARSFSPEDILLATRAKLEEIRAVGKTDGERWLYRFQPAEVGDPSSVDIFSAYGALDLAVHGEWGPSVQEDPSLKPWANFHHPHEVMRRLAQAHPQIVGFYSRERLGENVD